MGAGVSTRKDGGGRRSTDCQDRLGVRQLALDHGDIGEAKAVLEELKGQRERFDRKQRIGLDYLEALVAKASGDIDEAHRRLSALATSADRSVARSASVAKALLWGRTGRSSKALAELRKHLEGAAGGDRALLSERLHAAAWAGVLVVEASIGHNGVADRDLVDEIRSYYDRLDKVDRALGRRERLKALRIERAWLEYVVGGGTPPAGALPATATFPRDRGYLALLRSAQLQRERDHAKASTILLGWLQEEGDTDAEVAMRMYLALARLGRPKLADTAWRLIGRQFLATHTLSGRSDTLMRFRLVFAADVRRRLARGQIREAFGLATLYTGASFRRLRLQSCLSDPASGLQPIVKEYWAIRQRAAKTNRAIEGLSVEELRRHRADVEASIRAQDRLLDAIDKRCTDGRWRSWNALATTPSKTRDRIQASLVGDEQLILPFAGGFFVVTPNETEFVTSAGALPIPRRGRTFVVHEADRDLSPAFTRSGAQVWYLPDAGWLAARRTADCRATRPPLIVSDPQSDLPNARQAGRWLVEQSRGATHVFGERATVDAVQAAWRKAPWFFFGGHAVFDVATGETALVLADGRIGPAEILLRGDAPCIAVLLGCETAVHATGERPRMGVVDALLAAGATTVVATGERIEDRTAASLTRRLKFDTTAELETTLRQALSEMSQTHPDLRSDIQIWGAPPAVTLLSAKRCSVATTDSTQADPTRSVWTSSTRDIPTTVLEIRSTQGRYC